MSLAIFESPLIRFVFNHRNLFSNKELIGKYKLFFLQEIQANFTEDDSFGGGRLSTIPEVPSQATSVEEFDKILEEGPLPSSNESSPSFSNVSQNLVNSTKDESQCKGPFKNYVDKMRVQKVSTQGGGGRKKTKFCPHSCCMTPILFSGQMEI